ncbi:hypothetical protein [Nocardioides lianchengensis]|uniref:Uncharacterized protein n=1 Tax=Nocardioides lianchengensis TaxID=1045774 RepID=A0A1G6LWQ6_9ACTN|nr:hypothetical protein [Nocardioides lianchengensis]NYG12434.1 hypothetical protein [Nocardioides lianchengensis]SDC47146.1 hypothetical protein SAMN05421872_102370 [Nocardioides lianchengensis]
MNITGDATTNRGHMVPRHVWVAPTGQWHEKCPGFAWDRRRDENGFWEYLVSYVTGGGNVRPQQRAGWMSAALVRLVDEVKS